MSQSSHDNFELLKVSKHFSKIIPFTNNLQKLEQVKWPANQKPVWNLILPPVFQWVYKTNILYWQSEQTEILETYTV